MNAKYKRPCHVTQRGRRGQGGAETGWRSAGVRTEGRGGASRPSGGSSCSTGSQGSALSLSRFKYRQQ